MEKDIKKIISYDKNGFIINGKHEFLIGGEFHYFRVPAALWEDRLKKIKATGANLISVYIAWNMHEPEEGKQIWTGDYDLNHFLSLCEKYGFYVLIKPGPYICAELDFGGHPDWMIKKIANGEFRIRMLDEKYLELCKYWYKSCAEQINSHLITNGGTIIATQVENEYDHLMEYGEEQISEEDAVKYFMFLKDTMEEYGIDVPKFANEAEFLRGKGIIDTRTYYPNIPGKWMSEYERFEQKLLSSKKTQEDAPVMILELQAGWFSQIGEPSYIPGRDVIEGVSKSVFITGASIVNYYMMAGGTTFPYMGGRGDLVLGGYGNITSYDFGGAPVGETGEINKDKYYWIKGFIRFAKEFSHIIAESDGREDIKIISGGEDIAVLDKESSFLDVSAVKAYENFTVYQEGNKDGRFFFIRNAEAEDKTLSIEIPEELNGSKYMVKATVLADQTRMLPVAFKITENVRVNYSLSEIWMTQKYNNAIAVIMYGREETDGELCLNVPADKVTIISGDARKYSAEGINTILYYKHGSIVIIKAEDVIFFILGEEMTGRVDTLKDGILLHNVYYLEDIIQDNNKINLKLQIKENSGTKIMYYPLNGRKIKEALLDNTKITVKECKCGMHEISFETASFADRPEAEWTSGWKYCADSMETKENFDDSGWTELPEPVSLEEAGMFKHGYYWFRSSFETDREIKEAYLSFKHNDTDRYLVYINGSLVFRSRNKSINNHNITTALHKGINTIAVLYANEFHNKSHPHEGAIVKYSGIINPFTIKGSYSDGSGIDINISSFKVKYQLDGYNNGYHTTGYDDSGWQEAPEARKFVAGREMGHVIWFRRHFTYNPADGYTAPLYIVPLKADERLLIYVNGKPVAQYDITGPQEKFYIPCPYLDIGGDNVISMVLECPGFFEEIMSGYRRGYMYNPVIEPAYVSKGTEAELLLE